MFFTAPKLNLLNKRRGRKTDIKKAGINLFFSKIKATDSLAPEKTEIPP